MTCLAKRLRRFAMVSAVRAAARDDLKAHRRQMVAFIDNEMPIIAYDIVDLSFANKALNQCDINLTLWFATTTAYHAYRIARQA